MPSRHQSRLHRLCLADVGGRVPRDLTELIYQLVARQHRDPERGRGSLRAEPEPGEGGASHGSRQRTSWTRPPASGPPTQTIVHNGNRFVGCRAVEGREQRRDGRRHLPWEMGPVQSWTPVCRGAEQHGVSPQSIPRTENVEGAGNLMGGRSDQNRSAQTGGERVRCRAWVPVEESKATRGNNQTAQRPGAATDGNTPRLIIKGRRRSREANRTTTVRGTIL